MTEQRYFSIRRDGNLIVGTALAYGDVADLGGFEEVFMPGALKIRDDRHGVVLNLYHDRDRILARTGHGLTLKQDDRSVRFEADLPDTANAREARELIDAGLLQGASIEFLAEDATWRDGDLGRPPRRTVHKAILRGLAIVDTPAYPKSSLSARDYGYKRHPRAKVRRAAWLSI